MLRGYNFFCQQILCWGVRNLKKYRLGSVTSPFIKVECGGTVEKTNHIIDTRRNPNFTDGPIIMELVSIITINNINKRINEIHAKHICL